MNQKTHISIVTVTYNCVNTLEETIQSVIYQDYDNIEYIIIDGNSTDGTIDVINKYKSQITYYLSEKDNGVFDAMNKAITVATGNWIIFMNAGDSFVSNDIVRQIFEKKQYGNHIGAIFGKAMFIKGNSMKPYHGKPFFTLSGIRNMGICHQSIFVRTLLAKKYLFDITYKYAADYNMMMQIFKEGYIFEYQDVFIANYDLSGISSENKIIQYKEVAKICGYVGTSEYYLKLIRTYYNWIKRNIKRKITYYKS